MNYLHFCETMLSTTSQLTHLHWTLFKTKLYFTRIVYQTTTSNNTTENWSKNVSAQLRQRHLKLHGLCEEKCAQKTTCKDVSSVTSWSWSVLCNLVRHCTLICMKRTLHMNLQTKLLAKLREGDMVATEAKYHQTCLTSLYNRYCAHSRRKTAEKNELELIQGK